MNDEYVPSLINPRTRTVRRDSTFSQKTTRRLSLSLRKSTGLTAVNSPEHNDSIKENKCNTHHNAPQHINKEHKNNSVNANEDAYKHQVTLDNCDVTECNAVCTKSNNSSSNTLLYDYEDGSCNYGTVSEYDKCTDVSFGVNDVIDISSNTSAPRKVSHQKNETLVDCQSVENSQLSEYDSNEDMAMVTSTMQKEVAINLKLKRRKTENVTEGSKVLILNTDAIEKLNHVIVQPPNYNSVKRKISNNNTSKSPFKKRVLDSDVNNGGPSYSHLKQINLDRFFKTDVLNFGADIIDSSLPCGNISRDVVDMSKKSGVTDAVKLERVPRSYRSVRNNDSPRSARISAKKENIELPQSSSNTRNHSASSHSPRKNADSIQFSLPSRCQSNKTSACQRVVPHHKIVAGTHFAVDAFSYGEIPNVNHYFLTHFHSDHYTGLKKSFKKMLFCSKITADLCISRLGVNPKCINVIKIDETIRIEGVEVTALEANHCPGAVMLVFSLPNGKTLLHTGDFRASPLMESYAVFWNKDIHTIYLDTTYCNPRYDFPTQDQSLEMALYILRQKKLSLEKVGKKFTSVLIICGTYTIGKEKFFLGLARRVGCSVWACPEKDRVLQTVEGRSFSHALPQSCQLHIVPMRDLTHEKLRSYLKSLEGTFSEVVAFKPSGWENGKNSSVEKDSVTIHGIPYSEHSSFSEMIRFVKFLKPKQVIPTVDISGGVKSVQKYFPCPLVYKEDIQCQSKLTDYFSVQKRQQVPAVT